MADIDAGEPRGLAELGGRLALDDLSTGFGSFTYLKKLPMNYLKIDIEFIPDLTANPANLHDTRAIVGLAQRLRTPDHCRGRPRRRDHDPASRRRH